MSLPEQVESSNLCGKPEAQTCSGLPTLHCFWLLWRMLLLLTVFCAFSRFWKTLPCKKWNATRVVWSPACASLSPVLSLSWWDSCTHLCFCVLCNFFLPGHLILYLYLFCNSALRQVVVFSLLTFKFQNQEDSASSNPFALPNSVTAPLPTFARVTTAYGSYQDANIPFPRTSGARFCGAGWSFFGSLILDFGRAIFLCFYFLRTQKNFYHSVIWSDARLVSVGKSYKCSPELQSWEYEFGSHSESWFLTGDRSPDQAI